MAEVIIQNAQKAYGSVAVLHDINLRIPDGTFVVLVGASGCGKSTLLRMVAGLEEVTAGQILIDGREVNDLPPKERDIAMVFQNYGLYPHMTVAQNMGFALKLSKVDKVEIAQRVGRASDILDLNPLLDRLPRQLSGGQRQRVAMGRAIVRNPQVFLFDEPLSNLDAKLRVQMRAEIKQLQRQLKTTTLYVTHDQVEAMTMADIIVVMHAGVMKQSGPPLELYDRPANMYVAGFIGSPSMNFFFGQLKGEALDCFELTDGQTVHVPSMLGRAQPGACVLGVRPEDLSLSDHGISGEINLIEPTGAENYIGVRVGSQVVTAVFRERHPLSIGQTISIALNPQRLHLFDPGTELRIN